MEDSVSDGSERTIVGELGYPEHINAPYPDVVQAPTELLLVRGHHAVLGHLGCDGVQAVGVGQGLVADPLDGAHHLAAPGPRTHAAPVRLISCCARLQVHLLVLVWKYDVL